MGRETRLAPITWPKNGWPVVNGNRTTTINMTCPTLPLKPVSADSEKIELDTDKLPIEWNYVKFPIYDNYSLTEKKAI